ncbi:nicotinamidase-related amidase [Actinocorallia herbida]|uniref:Nicotinamidase-related amidase n=1 Tax=Actinocorallia herbida TaxID=58109 RepID=A0A3N1DCV5_9ACTN|nr:isochorismatase family cysteine hydrolase [Actinocorallia herbida]ROO91340.1 nicotinamidase-related amidase [Actinocorallia herbida]
MAQQALLVMDVQRVVVARFPDPAYLPRLQEAIAKARAAGLPVIYVTVGFRPGYPEVAPQNRMFGGLKRMPSAPDPALSDVHPDVAPEPGDPIVVKRRVSAFSGSDLDLLLRAQGITHLVLTGIATGGVVLSTLREAADLDYTLTVLADACLDADPEVHTVLTTKVFPMQADVMDTATWAP